MFGYYKYYKHYNIALHPYKALYFFIPKVACSTLKKACADMLGFRLETKFKILDEDVHYQHYPCVDRSEISTKYRDYYKFAFVRNPWDRVVSCYESKVMKEPEPDRPNFKDGVFDGFLRYKTFRPGMSFEEFICAIRNIPDADADAHIKSQYAYLTDSNGKIFMNFIGHFERLQDDFKEVSRRAFLPSVALPRLMKTKRRSYTQYYNAVTRQIVAERYRKDIELFEYRFET